jgi:hypothetical protein
VVGLGCEHGGTAAAALLMLSASGCPAERVPPLHPPFSCDAAAFLHSMQHATLHSTVHCSSHQQPYNVSNPTTKACLLGAAKLAFVTQHCSTCYKQLPQASCMLPLLLLLLQVLLHLL